MKPKLLDAYTPESSNIRSCSNDYSEVYKWKDGNTSNEDRIGYFVSIDTVGNDVVIEKATSASKVRGVTIANSGITTNASPSKFSDKESLKCEYSYVGLLGEIPVLDDGTCTVGGTCLPGDDGIATRSEKGYSVLRRIDATHILILVEPQTDSIVRETSICNVSGDTFSLDTKQGGIVVDKVTGNTHKHTNLWDGAYTITGTSLTFTNALNLDQSKSYVLYIGHSVGGISYPKDDGSAIEYDFPDGVTFPITTSISGTEKITINGYGTTFLNDVAVMESSDTYGLHSSGDLGCVDLGSLTWSAASDSRFYVSRTNMPTGITKKLNSPNIFCSKYTTTTNGNALWNNRTLDKAIGINLSNISDSNQLYVRDTSYSDVASFKSAMNGVLLAFEVADGQTPSRNAIVVEEHNESSTESKTIILPLSEPLYKDNYIDVEKAVLVKKYARVDLGSLTWTKTQDGNKIYFMATNYGMKSASDSVVANIYCEKYKSDTVNNVYYNRTDKTIAIQSSKVWVYDTTYTGGDVATFKSAMNGVYLIYELSTPTETPLTDEQIIALHSVKSFAGKTYIDTKDLFKATLDVEYSNSDVGALALLNHNNSKIQIEDGITYSDEYQAGNSIPRDADTLGGRISAEDVDEINSKIESSSWYYDGAGNLHVDKFGKVVTFNWVLEYTLESDYTWAAILYLPEKYTPKFQIYNYLNDGTQVVINTDGSVVMYGVKGSKYSTFSLSWCTN